MRKKLKEGIASGVELCQPKYLRGAFNRMNPSNLTYEAKPIVMPNTSGTSHPLGISFRL